MHHWRERKGQKRRAEEVGGEGRVLKARDVRNGKEEEETGMVFHILTSLK